MSIEVINPPYSVGDIGETADVLNKYGIGIAGSTFSPYFIFIEPRLLCKMQKLMTVPWVAKPNRSGL